MAMQLQAAKRLQAKNSAKVRSILNSKKYVYVQLIIRQLDAAKNSAKV